MSKVTITFLPDGKTVKVATGTTILDAARKAGIILSSPCGGDGLCRKCRVRVRTGEVDNESQKVFSEREQKAGYVLACEAGVFGDAVVDVPPESLLGGDVSDGSEHGVEFPHPEFEINPRVRKHFLQLSEPTLEDHCSDLTRLSLSLGKFYKNKKINISQKVLRTLPDVLRDGDWEVTVATDETAADTVDILFVEAKNSSKKLFGIAVDIGTTTVSVRLIDLVNMRPVGKETGYNSQISFGDDVINRILHAEKKNGMNQLRRAVIGDINRLVSVLLKRCRVQKKHILSATIVGNTTMQHLFLGIIPKYIRREPYIAGCQFYPSLSADEAGLKINPGAMVRLLPSVGSFVGADITAGVLSVGMHMERATSLFIDIGTNGEIVLGNSDWMMCCSASAGPAFEGAGISCGMRAAEGAIFDVHIDPASWEVHFKTIGGGKPHGLCGTGLIDLLAEMQRAGILDRTGEFNMTQTHPRLGSGDEPRFVVVPADFADGREIYISQSDVTNLIRSKAAIYAACKMIMKAVELDFSAVENIYVAGGFGNHLDVGNAVSIGLLPDVPLEKIKFMGNTALRGARLAGLSGEASAEIARIAGMMTYYELSTDPAFMDEFVAASFLPHTHIEEFPSVALNGGTKD